MQVEIRASYRRTLLLALHYLLGNEAFAAAERLSEAALIHLPDLLSRHPRAGRDYLSRNACTPRLQDTIERLHALLGADMELREILMGDHLVLYAIRKQTVHLLAMRHHRQTGFDPGD